MFDAGYTFFRSILITALRGGETEAGRAALTKPAQWDSRPLRPRVQVYSVTPGLGGSGLQHPPEAGESEALREFQVYSWHLRLLGPLQRSAGWPQGPSAGSSSEDLVLCLPGNPQHGDSSSASQGSDLGPAPLRSL